MATYGMSNPLAAKTINAAANRNNLAAKVQAPSWSSGSGSGSTFGGSVGGSSFPSLSSLASRSTGATGNTLYPAPKPSASAGYGMSSLGAANAINAMANRNNIAAAVSKMPAPSWSLGSSSSGFPSLSSLSKTTGVTGNTLYPAPRSTSPSGFPSLSGLYPSSSSTQSNRPSGGILGGPGQSSSPWQMPAPSWSTGGGGSPLSGQSTQGKLTMPGGFSGGLFGQAAAGGGGGGTGGTVPVGNNFQQAQAKAVASGAKPVGKINDGKYYGEAKPAGTPPNSPASTATQVAMQQKYGGPPQGPGKYSTPEEAAYHAGYYGGGPRYSYGLDGTVVGNPAPQQAPRPASPPPPVAVGRPATPAAQPVAVNPRPSAYIPQQPPPPPPSAYYPSADDLEAERQGRLLG